MKNKDKELTVELMKQVKAYIKDLKNETYFKLNIKDALSLNILPSLTAHVFKKIETDYLYFNKKSALYFSRLNHPDTITYAFTKFDTTTYDFLNNDKSDNEYDLMLTSTFLLWFGKGLELIKKDFSNYQNYKNEMFMRLLDLDAELMSLTMDIIINYIENLESKRYLNLLLMDLKTIQFIQKDKHINKTKGNLFNGKKLNIEERYMLANKLFDFDKIICSKNILKAEKNQLLAFILDINIDNAKKLLNGNYDSKPRISEIEKYIETLNK